MKNLEIKTIEHKGIKVSIKIDYDKGEVSLVDSTDNYKGKQWLFSKRGLEYLNGWQNIIEAMAVAVEECRVALETDNEAKRAAFEDNIIAHLANQNLN